MARKGQVTSEETRRKISEARKARVWTDEERRAMSERAKRFLGDAPRSEQHCRKISEALKGIKRSDETKRRVSEAKIGKSLNLTDEQRAEISERTRRVHTGKVLSEETRRKLSERRIGRTKMLVRYGITPDDYAAQITAGMKWCHEKKHFAPASSFNKKEGFCQECKPLVYRAALLRQKYGVDAAWYDAKLAEQGGVCAGCGTHEPSGKSKEFMSIDHNHETGQTRGLLCSACNFSLNRLETVPGWADRMYAYLARYAAEARQKAAPALPAQENTKTNA